MKDDKKYTITISGVEFDVTKEEYTKHHKDREHRKYLWKEERKVTIVSLDDIKSEDESYRDTIPDKSVNVEDTAINNVMIEELRKILKTLDKDELDLIDKLIYDEKSEREVAKKYGITHTALGKRWDKLRDKLRKLLEK